MPDIHLRLHALILRRRWAIWATKRERAGKPLGCKKFCRLYARLVRFLPTYEETVILRGPVEADWFDGSARRVL